MNRRLEIEGTKKNLNRALILPMCSINYKRLPENFINSYITRDYKVVIVFDKTTGYDPEFSMFFDFAKTGLKAYDTYEDSIDELALIFNIPEVFRDDFDKFIEGKYSKFSNGYKTVISNFFGRKTIKDSKEVTEHNVIYPEDFKRKQIADDLSFGSRSIIDWKDIHEVIDKPNLDKELYKPIDILLALNMNEEKTQKKED